MFKKSYSLALLLFCANFLFGQVTLEINAMPGTTAPDTKIYLAGSMNSWNPSDENYRLKKGKDGKFYLTLPESSAAEPFFYKITQGNWENPEGDASGDKAEDRKYLPTSGRDTVRITVLSWQKKVVKRNTAAANVTTQVINVPQLHTERRIWIYLPPGYENSGKRYAVIYMADGQNLFSEETAFSEEWKVDETMNSLAKNQRMEAIIVGIDNGADNRLNEYSPWRNKKYGGGLGALYADFVAQTLKGYIDKSYRTLPAAKNTALIGSSMGGLISFYTGLRYPEKFGKLGIFSPSFWFSKNELMQFVKENRNKIGKTKFYFLAGKKESPEMVADVQEIVPLLRKKGAKKKNISQKFDEYGTHSESYWSKEFAQSVLWLFGS